MTTEIEVDRQLLRNTYGTFPVGVTVVTTKDLQGRSWGMTASSFNSISMDPPLVSLSLIEQTPSLGALTNSDEFAISILAADQADLARIFATPSADKFRDVELAESPWRSPIVAGSAAWLVCRPSQVLPVGDHALLIAEVIAARASDRPVLAYQKGAFFSLVSHVEEVDGSTFSDKPLAGFIVEYESRIALARAEGGGWTLPTATLVRARTLDESLRTTARTLIGTDVEPDFLYSMVDLDAHVTCCVYRCRLSRAPQDADTVSWFGEGDFPWDQFGPTSLVQMINRYFVERVSDQFGVFVMVGKGRLAAIHSEAEWVPDRSAATQGEENCPTSTSKSSRTTTRRRSRPRSSGE